MQNNLINVNKKCVQLVHSLWISLFESTVAYTHNPQADHKSHKISVFFALFKHTLSRLFTQLNNLSFILKVSVLHSFHSNYNNNYI